MGYVYGGIAVLIIGGVAYYALSRPKKKATAAVRKIRTPSADDGIIDDTKIGGVEAAS